MRWHDRGPALITDPAPDLRAGRSYHGSVTSSALWRAPERCPGLIRPASAADGALVRLRIPGGRISCEALAGIAEVAVNFGAPTIQLTSRGNLQLRGLPVGGLRRLVEAITATGLIPHPAHELARNVVASPLSGLDDQGRSDISGLVGDLDRRLCATPELARLPGRFLFTLDDGRGDVLNECYDLGYQAIDEDRGVVLTGYDESGWLVRSEEAVSCLITLATEFLAARERMTLPIWRVRELPDRLRPPMSVGRPAPDRIPTAHKEVPQQARPLGVVANAAVVGVPLGLLTPQQVTCVVSVLTKRSGDELRVTPWRSLVLPGAADALDELAEVGLVTDPSSAWAAVTACIGRPACTRSTCDPGALARQLVAAVGQAPEPAIHVSGCERRCGAPAGADHLDLVSPTSLEEILGVLALAR